MRKVLIEEGLAIKSELYVSFLVDRSVGWPVCIASSAGGMEIEKVAAETPEKILRAEVDPAVGVDGVPGSRDRVRAWAGG